MPVVARVEYLDSVAVRVRWLCFTVFRVPAPEKKPKKKKEKKEKPKKEKEKKEEEKPKEKKPSAFQRFYEYQGIPGFVELLRRVVHSLKRFGRGVWNAFRIRELSLHMVLTGGDPAALVDQYGKVCAGVYPGLGWLSTHIHARKGAIRADIRPDFTGLAEKTMECTAEISLVPLVLIAAVIMLALRLVFQVVIKFLNGAKPPKQDKDLNPKETAI